MSVELLLIPAAIAAVAAVRAARAGTGVMTVGTRMKNRPLLSQACRNAGALSVDEQTWTTSWDDMQISFDHQEDGTLVARVLGSDSEPRIEQVITAIDREYGKLVQEQVLKRIQENVDRLGMRVESRRDNEDSSVTVVLEVLS